MPFLPFVLLIAWQAISRSASFALGWATALYFGQVPGRQGRILSVISLLALAWVVVIVGFALPISIGAGLETLGVIPDNFDVELLHVAGLVAGVLLTPPFIAGAVVWGGFLEDRSVGRWLRLVPVSYPASFMLGISVLQMVVLTPWLLFQRWRRKRKLVQVAVVMREGTDDDDLFEAVRAALKTAGLPDATAAEAKGPKAWPMRTIGYASEHLLGAVVRGDPIRIAADGIEILAYATNIAILGPKEEAYRLRAAVVREIAFNRAYLTWNEEAQDFEDALIAADDEANGDMEALRKRLDEVQQKIDIASLNTEEWNVLYRIRLQVETRAAERHANR